MLVVHKSSYMQDFCVGAKWYQSSLHTSIQEISGAFHQVLTCDATVMDITFYASVDIRKITPKNAAQHNFRDTYKILLWSLNNFDFSKLGFQFILN